MREEWQRCDRMNKCTSFQKDWGTEERTSRGQERGIEKDTKGGISTQAFHEALLWLLLMLALTPHIIQDFGIKVQLNKSLLLNRKLYMLY